MFYAKIVKRPLDFFFALIALILLFPLLFIIAFLVRIKLSNPVIFRQERPGKNEKIFTLYKFRTMTNKKNKKGELFSDSKRLTKFGKFLRKTSLDELPEFYNILKGEMSFVGPRPLLVQYLPLYNKHQKRRHEVRPGLSGLAQVNGRNNISWEQRFELDVRYVDNITFIGDLKIIISTIVKVFKHEGINSQASETMEYFTGSNN